VRPGEAIVGTLDFRDAVVLCTQYCVSLVAVEQVPPEASAIDAKDFSSLPASGNKNKSAKKSSSRPTMPSSSDERVAHAVNAEVCVGLDATFFEVHVPDHATPSFATGICKQLNRLIALL